MKWYQSLIFKITTIFFFAFLGLCVVGVSSVIYQYEEQKDSVEDLAKAVFRNAYIPPLVQLDIALLEQDGFILKKDMGFLTKYADDDLFEQHKMKKGRHVLLDVVEYNGAFYVLARLFKQNEILVFLAPKEPTSPLFAVVFVLLGIVLLALYIITIKSILPLLSLKKNIIALGDGELQSPKKSDNKDEIGTLTNAFYDTIEKIKHLKNSRALFLRNIMHELKTPITKARFALAMTQESVYKDKMESLFLQQEILLEEFSRIEKLGAKELNLDIKPYHLDDILAQVIELIPKIEPNITIKSQDLVLHVDYNLFCVALKNLLDNALNYSNDAHASLVVDGQNITISNQGEPLKYPLENYHEPYFLGDKKSKESRGLGFGLYIALEVFRLHHTICTYTHQNGQSIFKINIKSIL